MLHRSVCGLTYGKEETYIICHLVLETDALGLEELFERLLLLAVKVSGRSSDASKR